MSLSWRASPTPRPGHRPLAEFKAAVREGKPDDTPVPVEWQEGEGREPTLPLGRLRSSVLSVTPGQRVAYVTDVASTPTNEQAILDLAQGADVLFIEAAFARADAAVAAERAHLTTIDAGVLARKAAVHRVEPFHSSARYAGEKARMIREVDEAFRGDAAKIDSDR